MALVKFRIGSISNRHQMGHHHSSSLISSPYYAWSWSIFDLQTSKPRCTVLPLPIEWRILSVIVVLGHRNISNQHHLSHHQTSSIFNKVYLRPWLILVNIWPPNWQFTTQCLSLAHYVANSVRICHFETSECIPFITTTLMRFMNKKVSVRIFCSFVVVSHENPLSKKRLIIYFTIPQLGKTLQCWLVTGVKWNGCNPVSRSKIADTTIWYTNEMMLWKNEIAPYIFHNWSAVNMLPHHTIQH